jgi:phage gp29-like protein
MANLTMLEKFRDRVIGVFNTPSSAAAMRKQVSYVDAAQARPPFQGHLAFGMTPQRLGAILRAADEGNTMDWFTLAEEIEENYPHYASVLSKRRRQVCQLPIRVEAAGDSPEQQRDAKLIEEWLDTDVLQDALFDMTDAIGKGFSVMEILWETTPLRFRPIELIYRPQRFFEVSWADGNTIWLRNAGAYSDLPGNKFVQHLHKSKSGNIVRAGLTRMVAFLWMYAAFTARDWQVFVQSYGMPIRLGRYGPEASGSDKNTLWRAVSQIAGDVAAIIPKSMEIEFVKDTDRAAGATLYEKRADWLDRSVSKLVLGGTAGTDAISGGHAVGKEHRSAEQDVERFDARLLGVTITRQIVRQMIIYTYGEQPTYPRVLVGQEESPPIKDVIAAIADTGLRVKASQLREKLDLDDPEDGDETVGGVPPGGKPPVSPGLSESDPQSSLLGPLRALVARHTAEPDPPAGNDPDRLVEALTVRLARQAANGLGAMTDQVRAQVEAARDLKDLRRRLEGLKLESDEFAVAMAQGMALAEVVGQASVMAQIGRRRP